MFFYVDESGSMDVNIAHPFIIAVLATEDPKKLKRLHKYFISKYLMRLRALDGNDHKMFDVNGRFRELKGAQLDAPMKRAFINFFTQSGGFRLYPIILDNKNVRPQLYANKARAFNYMLKLLFMRRMGNGNIPKEDFDIQLDERNIRTKTKYVLCEYLNTELMLAQGLDCKVKVAFFSSECNHCVQLADVFANIIYSNEIHSGYETELKQMKAGGYLANPLRFP